jgi:hypothetical protein
MWNLHLRLAEERVERNPELQTSQIELKSVLQVVDALGFGGDLRGSKMVPGRKNAD